MQVDPTIPLVILHVKYQHRIRGKSINMDFQELFKASRRSFISMATGIVVPFLFALQAGPPSFPGSAGAGAVMRKRMSLLGDSCLSPGFSEYSLAPVVSACGAVP